MKITFKGRKQDIYNMNGTMAYSYIKVPTLTKGHVDMNAARKHHKYGSYVNSTLFPGMLERIKNFQKA